MTVISATLVSELRTKSGAGMLDCKKALEAAGGNIEEALDWLRKKGIASAAKKADRAATEGVVAIATAGTQAVVVEVNSETDFVARNDQFQQFVRQLANSLVGQIGKIDFNSLEALQAVNVNGKTAQECLTELIATIGENMSLRRATALIVNQGVVVPYLHNPIAEGLGKIGVLVAVETTATSDAVATLGKQVAMHIAATRPEALSRADVDAAMIERERAILVEQARASGKPEEIIAKMVEGRLSKFYEEVALLEQTFVIDGESKVQAVVEKTAATAGAPVAITGFVRFGLGEGLEKKQDNFAEEVAKMAS